MLPETFVCELSRLRYETLEHAGPTVAGSDKSDDSDKTLTGNDLHGRRRQRDEDGEFESQGRSS